MSELEVLVKYDYASNDESTLNIKSGEVVTIIEKDLGNGWCKVRNRKTEEGYIPSNYVEIKSLVFPNMSSRSSSEFNDEEDEEEHTDINEDLEQISLSKFETNLRSKAKNIKMPKYFLNDGGEDFIYGLDSVSKEIEAKIEIMYENSTEICIWKPLHAIPTCSIISSVKPSKSLKINACVKYKIKSSYFEYPISRRFRNFVWLHTQMQLKYPCIVIPTLPPKQITGRFETEFIEIRKQSLQRWLDKVTMHPVLGTSQAVKLFLSVDDEEQWKREKEALEKDRHKKGYFFNLVEAPSDKIDWKNKSRQIDCVSNFIDKLEKEGKSLKINFGDFHKVQNESCSKLLKKIGGSIVSLSEALKLDPGKNHIDIKWIHGIQTIGDAYDEIGKLLNKNGKAHGDFIDNNLGELNGVTSKIKPLITLAKSATDFFDSKSDVEINPETLETVDRNLRVITRSVDAELNWLQQQREIHLKSTFVQSIKNQIELHRNITEILTQTLSFFD